MPLALRSSTFSMSVPPFVKPSSYAQCIIFIMNNQVYFVSFSISVTDLIMIKEFYQHRQDKLHSRIHNHRSGWITESFHEGRSHCLKGNPSFSHIDKKKLICKTMILQTYIICLNTNQGLNFNLYITNWVLYNSEIF